MVDTVIDAHEWWEELGRTAKVLNHVHDAERDVAAAERDKLLSRVTALEEETAAQRRIIAEGRHCGVAFRYYGQ